MLMSCNQNTEKVILYIDNKSFGNFGMTITKIAFTKKSGALKVGECLLPFSS